MTEESPFLHQQSLQRKEYNGLANGNNIQPEEIAKKTKPQYLSEQDAISVELLRQIRTSIPAAIERLLYSVPWLLGLRVVGHACTAEEMAGVALATTIMNVLGISIAQGIATGLTTLVGQAKGNRTLGSENEEHHENHSSSSSSIQKDDNNPCLENGCHQSTPALSIEADQFIERPDKDDDDYRHHLLRVYLYRGLAVGLLLTLPVSCSWLKRGFVRKSLIFLGQDVMVATTTEHYLRILSPGLCMYSIYVVLKTWLQSNEMAHLTTYAVLLGVCAHVPTIYALVYGAKMGYLGAAWSTVMFQTVQASFLMVYMWKNWKFLMTHDRHENPPVQYTVSQDNVGTSRRRKMGFDLCEEVTQAIVSPRGIWQYLELALPGIVLVSEWWASELAIFLSGHIKKPSPSTNLDAITIYQSINVLCFGFSQGCNVGGSTRVSNCLGGNNAKGARIAAFVCILCSATVTTVMGLILYLTPHSFFPSLFSPDGVVVSETSKTISLLAFYVFADGVSSASTGIVKGCGRQGIIMPIVLIAYWVVGIPIAYVLAFGWRNVNACNAGSSSQGQLFCGDGIVGLVAGLLAGTWTHMILLGLFIIFKIDWEEERKRAQARLSLERG